MTTDATVSEIAERAGFLSVRLSVWIAGGMIVREDASAADVFGDAFATLVRAWDTRLPEGAMSAPEGKALRAMLFTLASAIEAARQLSLDLGVLAGRPGDEGIISRKLPRPRLPGLSTGRAP